MPDPAPPLPALQSAALSAREFEAIRRLARQRFGLDLKPGKEELVSARLGKKLREGNFRSYREYVDFVVADRTGEALMGLIDALTTNFTSFFREEAHFEFLRRTALPELRRKGPIGIWCAACSTGEEPYSIAFTIRDEWEGAIGPEFHILATDISTRALQAARAAVYPAQCFERQSAAWLRKYLLRGEGKWRGHYRVKPALRRTIEFRRLNLIEPFSHARPFHLIFCRNVMIYFDKATQAAVVNRLAEWLEPGGYLLVGHAESLTGISHSLRYVQPAVYAKPGGEAGTSARERSGS
ncbi:MAG: protein-glutamate O-methyltransferase CheR [Bryobacteraceae bacterium]|nr:protein-glutamate O-methyltransferase CheR [Bryobacteraceae bacterium]